MLLFPRPATGVEYLYCKISVMIPVEYLTVLFTLCLNEKSAEKKKNISMMCNKRINTVISRL